MKKNLIYILGGAAALYFIFMKKKGSAPTSSMMPVSPDQELAPAFVQTSTRPGNRSRKTTGKRGIAPVSSLMTVANEMQMDQEPQMEVSPSSNLQLDQSSPIVLSRKAARQEARSVKQEVRASGGSKKQARQAARSVRKEARQARRMGELPVLF